MTDSLTRRAMLGALTAFAGGVAGCGGRTANDDNTTSTTATTETTTPIAAVDVGSTALEVRLVDDHDVSELILRGPNGDTVAQATVAADTRSVSLPILAIEPERTGYEHYQPGQHTLVAETPARTHSTAVPLQPDLRITSVEQYRDGTSPASLGKVAVTVENRGSGPTWVYDIAFEGSPNFAANDELSPDPGLLRVSPLQKQSEAIIAPEGNVTFLSDELPIAFPQSAENRCNTTTEFTLRTGTPTDTDPTATVRMTAAGETHELSSMSTFTCDETTVEIDRESGDNQ